LYASPLFQATPTSTHGYDVCAFDKISSIAGGSQGFERFTAKFTPTQPGLLLDMVPNHMGRALPTRCLSAETGRNRATPVLHINWKPEKPVAAQQGPVPVLEDHYAKASRAETPAESATEILYRPHEQKFQSPPVAPAGCAKIPTHAQ